MTTTFRTPKAKDGAAIYHLIARCPPLDTNSRYCNLLQCTHFADTSIVAENNGALQGFISGYLDPTRADTLFVWQVAVAPESRGQRLASRMLEQLLQHDACRDVEYLTTSITRANDASWRTFQRLARTLNADLTAEPWLSSREHFEAHHESEHLVRIGPIAANTQLPIAREAQS